MDAARRQEIAEQWPECDTAVSFCERFITEEIWDDIRPAIKGNPSLAVTAVVVLFGQKYDEQRAHIPRETQAVAAVFLRQVKTEQFRRYIAAKLGLM